MNLVYIFTDQQRRDTMAAYGNEEIRTRNLDRLARESAVFRQPYVAQPLCSPSRATIMTGLYPRHHGVYTNNIRLRDEVPTLVELVDDRDYASMYVGKWHLGNEIFRQHGFDQWVSIDDQYRRHYDPGKDRTAHSSYYHYLRDHGFMPDHEMDDGFVMFSRGLCTRVPEPFSKTAFVGRHASEFIRQNRERPFMLCVNFFEPHGPINSAYDGMYDPEELGYERIRQTLGDDAPVRIRSSQLKNKDITESEWRRLRARYYGMVSLVDKYVGRILDTIADCGLNDNTLVVFTSDHGDMLGDFGLRGKNVMYRSASSVPLLIRVPGVTDEQRIIEGPVSLVDLVPTVLDIMGCPAKRRLDGRSLHPVIKGEEQIDRDVFIEWSAPLGETAPGGDRKANGACRTVISPDGWRLSLNEADKNELYNLNEDPCELHNLYNGRGYEKIRTKLTEKILAWQRENGDTVKLAT